LFFGALPFAYSTYWWDGAPYYYADNNYYQWDGAADAYETVAPPAELAAAAGQGAPTTDPATTADLFAYPRSNQSTQQQARDRQECSQWATQQTSTQAATTQPSTSAVARTHSDYLRAEAACLTARGYSVR
jgi:siderophore synthetase component